MLHLPFRMLDNRSFDGDMTGGDNRGPSESILARANLMYLGERQNVPNTDVVEAGHSQKVLGSKKMLFASNGSYYILVGLRANKIEGARGGRRCSHVSVKCPDELLAYMWHFRNNKFKSVLRKKDTRTRGPRPASHRVRCRGLSARRVWAEPGQPGFVRRCLNSDKTFVSEKLAALATTRLLISNPSHLPSSFLSLLPSLYA